MFSVYSRDQKAVFWVGPIHKGYINLCPHTHLLPDIVTRKCPRNCTLSDVKVSHNASRLLFFPDKILGSFSFRAKMLGSFFQAKILGQYFSNEYFGSMIIQEKNWGHFFGEKFHSIQYFYAEHMVQMFARNIQPKICRKHMAPNFFSEFMWP